MEWIKATPGKGGTPDHYNNIPVKINGRYSVASKRYNPQYPYYFKDDTGDIWPYDQIEWLSELTTVSPDKIKETARLYAESRMIENWDRQDHIMIGIFYKHFIDKMSEYLWLKPVDVAGGELKELLTYFFNDGYGYGHHHTVEGSYTDVHHTDMKTYHDDVVSDIIKDSFPSLAAASLPANKNLAALDYGKLFDENADMMPLNIENGKGLSCSKFISLMNSLNIPKEKIEGLVKKWEKRSEERKLKYESHSDNDLRFYHKGRLDESLEVLKSLRSISVNKL